MMTIVYFLAALYILGKLGKFTSALARIDVSLEAIASGKTPKEISDGRKKKAIDTSVDVTPVTRGK